MTQESAPDPLDVRLRGFASRASLAAAWAWLDALPATEAPERMPLAAAGGRVLAEAVVAPPRSQASPRAACNGYAVRAAACDGASAYNPLPLTAAPIASGWTLPEGTDTVLPFEAAEPAGHGRLNVLAPVAPGTGVDVDAGLAGGAVLPRGRRLLPQDLVRLAAFGAETVSVLPRPRVRLLVPGPKAGPDMLTPMLLALLDRDGAQMAQPSPWEGGAGLDAPFSGITLIAGRSGTGPDDGAAPALRARGGQVGLHGLALSPGGSAGLGTLCGQPVLLLPGEPFACRVAYDLLAARLLRRLSGLPAPAYATMPAPLARKIASGIGLAEVVPIRLVAGQAQPLSAETGLAALAADGFVLIPEASEGSPAGTSVRVHLYSPADSGLVSNAP